MSNAGSWVAQLPVLGGVEAPGVAPGEMAGEAFEVARALGHAGLEAGRPVQVSGLEPQSYRKRLAVARKTLRYVPGALAAVEECKERWGAGVARGRARLPGYNLREYADKSLPQSDLWTGTS